MGAKAEWGSPYMLESFHGSAEFMSKEEYVRWGATTPGLPSIRHIGTVRMTSAPNPTTETGGSFSNVIGNPPTTEPDVAIPMKIKLYYWRKVITVQLSHMVLRAAGVSVGIGTKASGFSCQTSATSTSVFTAPGWFFLLDEELLNDDFILGTGVFKQTWVNRGPWQSCSDDFWTGTGNTTTKDIARTGIVEKTSLIDSKSLFLSEGFKLAGTEEIPEKDVQLIKKFTDHRKSMGLPTPNV